MLIFSGFWKWRKKATVKLAAARTGHDDVPLGKKRVAHEQLKPVKSSALLKLSEEMVSDSSTNTADTDVELSQRQQIIANPVKSQDSGNTEHPEREDNIAVIGYKPKAVREAICLCLVAASLQNSERKTIIQILNKNSWLTDDHMTHYQALLKHQFPEVDGQQSCAIFEAVGHSFVGTPTQKSVQILNVSSNH